MYDGQFFRGSSIVALTVFALAVWTPCFPFLLNSACASSWLGMSSIAPNWCVSQTQLYTRSFSTSTTSSTVG